jgi:hypothetical protein
MNLKAPVRADMAEDSCFGTEQQLFAFTGSALYVSFYHSSQDIHFVFIETGPGFTLSEYKYI